MVWFFDRDGESVRPETQYEADTAEFVLTMHMQKGGLQVERFTDAVSFRERLEVLETQLVANRWTQRGPMSLNEGWKL